MSKPATAAFGANYQRSLSWIYLGQIKWWYSFTT